MANPTGHTFKNGTVLCRGCYAGHLNLERKIRYAASSEGRDDPQSSCPASVITFKQLLRRYQTLAEVQAHGPGFPYAQECSSTTEGCPEPPFYLVRTGVTGAARESAGAMTVDSYLPGPGSRSATVLACTLNGPLVVSATTSSSSSGRSGSRETLGGAMWRVGI